MCAKHTVADVLNLEQEHLEVLGNTSWNLHTLHALREYCTKDLGDHLDWCTHCGKFHFQFNSCRNRHCPTCQGHKQHQWAHARTKELLPVPLFHLVFTLADHRNRVSLSHLKKEHIMLFETAWLTLCVFGNNHKHLGATLGTIAVLHAWGQNLQLYPHLHCIFSKGGFSKAGYWKKGSSKDDFLFCVKTLSKKFRGVFVAKLRKEIPSLPQELGDILFYKNWVVYAKAPFGKAEQMLAAVP
jgi:hypothetical protein